MAFSFCAGPYSATHNSVTIGVTEDGYNVEISAEKELITTDHLGSSVVDGVYRGGQCHISAVLQEFLLAQVKLALWPYATIGTIGKAGRLDSALTSALVLDALANRPADVAAGYQTLTATGCILAENFPVGLLLSTRYRRIPIRWRILPTGSFDAEIWFSTT